MTPGKSLTSVGFVNGDDENSEGMKQKEPSYASNPQSSAPQHFWYRDCYPPEADPVQP